jgi:hypothetical protein
MEVEKKRRSTEKKRRTEKRGRRWGDIKYILYIWRSCFILRTGSAEALSKTLRRPPSSIRASRAQARRTILPAAVTRYIEV